MLRKSLEKSGVIALRTHSVRPKRSRNSVIALLCTLTLVSALFTGCSAPTASTEESSATLGSPATAASAPAADVGSVDDSGFDFSYTDRDLDPSWDEARATIVTLADNASSASGEGVRVEGNIVTIAAEGCYLVRGKLSDGELIVDAGEAKLQVVLDGASITNSNGPALLIEQADKVFLTLADGSTNNLTDSAARSDILATEEAIAAAEELHAIHNATLYSHDDLTINGSGALTVTGTAANAIVSRDDLVITGGDFTITAANDALKGKDCVKILDGTFELQAGDDAIVADKENDAMAGYLGIDGGSLTIAAADDAIHAETMLRITGGSIDITSCEEGIEGAFIQIKGGDISLVSSDDGLNATSDYFSGLSLEISGGTLFVDAEGDGLDSNGSLTISGGTTVIAGPTRSGNGALDYTSTETPAITGGILLAVDAGGMSQGLAGSDSQPALTYAGARIAAGETLSLVDANGAALFSYQAAKEFSTLVFSSPELTVGSDYRFVSGASLPSGAAHGFVAGGSISGGTELISFTLSLASATVANDGTVSEMVTDGEFGGMGGGFGAPGGVGPRGPGEVGAPRGLGGTRPGGGDPGAPPEGDWE